MSRALALAGALVLAGPNTGAAAAKPANPRPLDAPAISGLSSPADPVSGGDAVIAVPAPRGVSRADFDGDLGWWFPPVIQSEMVVLVRAG